MVRKLCALLLALMLSVSPVACGSSELTELVDTVSSLADELSEDVGYEFAEDDADLWFTESDADVPQTEPTEETVSEDGVYSSKEDVSRYLFLYGHLPGNYVTKQQARDAGWDSSAGNLWDVLPGKSIGGDVFGNYEGLLPEGRKWYECDIGYEGGFRNAKRIVFSEDGLIYYTDDHYESFELLYGN